MKKLLKKILPLRVVRLLKSLIVSVQLRRAYRYDQKRYGRYSSSVSALVGKHNLAAMLTERYHSIEKGLSLPAPRHGFGRRSLGELLHYLGEYERTYGNDDLTETVRNVLMAYISFNVEAGVSPSEIPFYNSLVDQIAKLASPPKQAGAVVVHREDLLEAVGGVELSFFATRHSVRQFSGEAVSHEDIEFATMAAQRSPAVCNRQFGKIYAYTDRLDIDRVLEVQNGARGFADQLAGVAVITTNLRSYWNDGQRNQAWIDGGLFSMSFMLGLHARGLGAVALNWSKGPKTDQAMRQATGIPQDEAIIMLVGFGHLRSEFRVASSPRLPLNEALSFPHTDVR